MPEFRKAKVFSDGFRDFDEEIKKREKKISRFPYLKTSFFNPRNVAYIHRP